MNSDTPRTGTTISDKQWAEQNGWTCVVHGNGQSEHWKKDGVRHWAPWMLKTKIHTTDDEVITNADIVRACVDKLASECKLNPTAYQRDAKEHLLILERENNQLRSTNSELRRTKDFNTLELIDENNQLRADLKQCAKALEDQLCLEDIEHIRIELKAILALPSVQNALKGDDAKA